MSYNIKDLEIKLSVLEDLVMEVETEIAKEFRKKDLPETPIPYVPNSIEINNSKNILKIHEMINELNFQVMRNTDFLELIFEELKKLPKKKDILIKNTVKKRKLNKTEVIGHDS